MSIEFIGIAATDAAHVLNATTRLKVLIAHRPGFVGPTLVARKLWGRELVPLLREEAARTPVGEPDAAAGALTA